MGCETFACIDKAAKPLPVLPIEAHETDAVEQRKNRSPNESETRHSERTSAMNVLYRILAFAMGRAYHNARQLGMSAAEAEAEAFEIAEFIKRMMS